MFRDLRELLSWLEGRDRRRWYALVPLATSAALVEAVGALAVFGLFRLVIEPGRVGTTPMVSDVARLWSGDPQATVAFLTVATMAFYVGRGALLVATDRLRERAVHRSAARVAGRLLTRYLKAEYAFHLQRRSASMIDQISRSAELAFQLCASSAINLLAEALTLAALAGALVLSAPVVTLSAVGVVLAAVGLVVVATRWRWTTLGNEEAALAGTQLQVLQQSLGGIKDVIITGRQGFFEARFHDVRRSLVAVKEQRVWLSSSSRIGIETGLIVAMLILLLVVVWRRAVGAEVVSILALFAYTGFRVVPSANRLMLNLGYLREAHAYVDAVARDLSSLSASARPLTPEPVIAFANRIRFDGVSLTHEGATRPSLSEASFEIRVGESIGIVGPTGAGKSTLVDVLLGLLPPTKGRILIDDVPLPSLERAWQRLIGYVPQDVYLLDDTLRRNIAFGVADSLIDEPRVRRAATLARLDEVVAGLSEGFETVVGERGVRLSGGQRQRVAIARALYHDPPVLVFDEATAALDSQTEREVTAAIGALHGTRTLIAIAHRLSTVRDCDRLIYLREGRIEAIGTYDELVRTEGFRGLA